MADSTNAKEEHHVVVNPPSTPESDEVFEKNNVSETVTTKAKGEDGEPSDVPQPHLHAKTFLAVFAVFMIYAAQLFAIVGAGTQGNAIATHFGRPGDVVWVVAPITILTTVLSPIISQASDFWGRKWFLIIPTLFGAIGSAVIARATSMDMVIAGTCLVGIAFGAQPLLHTVSSEVLPRRWRSWAQACVMISNCFGGILGILVGGALNRYNDPNGFRTYFYIAIGLFTLTAVICVFTYQPLPTPSQSSLSFSEKLCRLDWIGYLLLATSIVLFSVGLSWSQNPFPWSDAHVSATFAVGVILGVALVVYEVFFTKEGMFHHGLFTNNRNFTISLLCVFCEGLAFFAANVYFSFQTGVLYETDNLINGVRFSIMFISTFVAALVVGLYCALSKRVKWATFAAFVIFTAFFGCMASSTKDSSIPVWGYPVLLGWALGMCLVLLVTVAQLSTPPELIATASGLIISVRSLGGTVGLAIYTTVFNAGMGYLPGNIAEAVIGAGLPTDSVPQFIGALTSQNQTAIGEVPGVDGGIIGAGVAALLDTYAKSFRNIWLTALPFVAVAALATLFLIDPTEEFNNRIDAAVEKDEDLYSL